MKWIEHCNTMVHCLACRTSEPFQRSILAAGLGDVRTMECPRGYRLGEVPPVQEREVLTPADIAIIEQRSPCVGCGN